jgi:hypothetical protein
VENEFQRFSLLGDPLHRLGKRLGLIRESDTVGFGVALGLFAWVVLVLPGLLRGEGPKIFSLTNLSIHVRLLFCIPLFFLCETMVVPKMALFVEGLARSAIIPIAEQPVLAERIRRISRIRDSWLVEIALLLLAFILPLEKVVAQSQSTETGNWIAIFTKAWGHFNWFIDWYLWFCLPFFRFLILRWLLRLVLWWYFLWCVQRLKLQLIPTHPDGSAGLGYVEFVHEQFLPLALGISAVVSASFAEKIFAAETTLNALYGSIAVLLAIQGLLFIAPLLIFAPKLAARRVTGLAEYTNMASDYVTAFDKKWIRGENPSGESLLGSQDIQALADLANGFNVVRKMRTVPVEKRLLIRIASGAVIPFLPLLLFEYPVVAIALKVVKALVGF